MLEKNEFKLVEIANVQVGYQARGKIEENLNGEYKIIRPQDFDKKKNLLVEDLMRFSPSIVPKAYLVDEGDILVQARGQNHTAILVRNDLEYTVASNSFYLIHSISLKKILPEYLKWWLNRESVQNYFQRERGVSTIPFISLSTLKSTRIQIPPLETQETISKLIQLWEREERLQAQLKNKKEALIQEVCKKVVHDSIRGD